MVNTVFEEQSDAFDIIDNQVLTKRLSHAYMIESNNYYQTNVLVKELCKRIINSSDSKVNYLIDNDEYPDIRYIYPDGDYIKKAQLLSVIKDFSETSMLGDKKIYVINQAEKLNDSSANTILKFLEEPVAGVFAILVCNSRYNVINTILSRCQILYLKAVDCDNISNQSENIERIANILLLGKGAFEYYVDLQIFFVDRKTSINILQELIHYFYNVYKDDNIVNFNISSECLLYIILILETAIKDLNYNINFKLFLDKLIIDIGEVI